MRVRFSVGILAAVFWLLAAQPAPAADAVPNSVRWLLADVGQLIDQKAYPEALKKLKDFMAKGGPAPDAAARDKDVHHHATVYFAMGNCQLLMEQYAPAEKSFAEVVRQRPEMVSARVNLAKACYEQTRYADAARHFRAGYDLSPDKAPEPLYYSAAAYLLARDYKKSIAAFELLLKAHPDKVLPDWKTNWVYALMGDGQARRALPYIEELIALYTGEQRIRWQEALVHQYLQLKMEKKALAYTEQLTREAPAESRWWKLLSQIRLYDGNYADALAALTIYGYLKPLTVEEKKVWADLNLHLGIPAQAAPVYTELLAGDRDSKTVKKLVSAFRQLGRPADALVCLDKCEEVGDDADLLMLRADLLYEMKRFKDAAAAYRTVAAKDHDHPQCGKAWLMAGYAAWQNKEIGPSRQAFQHAAKFNKQRKTALAAIRQLEALN